MSRSLISLGKKGEKLALEYLKKHGYSIKSKNHRSRLGEVDIIADDDGVLVFVEVKTRRGLSHGTPQESVTRKKQLQLSMVAQEYLSQKKLHDRPARFDVISILIANDEHIDIEQFQNAFELSFGF